MTDAAQILIGQEIDCIYVDYVPFFASAVAACSEDKIEASPVRLVGNENTGYYYEAFPATVNQALFAEEKKAHGALVLSESNLNETSSFYELSINDGSLEQIMNKLELIAMEENPYESLYLYRIKDASVIH